MKFQGIDWEEVSEEEFKAEAYRPDELKYYTETSSWHYFRKKKKRCSKCGQVVK